MSNRAILVVFLFLTSGLFAQGTADRDHLVWLTQRLAEIETIKAGMTRLEVRKLFKEDGGFSARTRQRFVLKRCPFIKVDVDFEATPGSPRQAEAGDKVVAVSKPFLESPRYD